MTIIIIYCLEKSGDLKIEEKFLLLHVFVQKEQKLPSNNWEVWKKESYFTGVKTGLQYFTCSQYQCYFINNDYLVIRNL